MGKFHQPVSCGLNREEILAFAENIFSILKLSPGSELDSIVSHLKGKIKYFQFNKDTKHIASITVQRGGNFVICLSNFIFPLQKRFAIAHELGHLFLHSRYGEIPIKAFNDDYFGDNLIEIEASIFACGFLMPNSLLEKAKKLYAMNSVQIASYFMIPEPIVRQYISFK